MIIKKLGMPLISYGFDQLKWPEVRQIIEETFEEQNIEVCICIK